MGVDLPGPLTCRGREPFRDLPRDFPSRDPVRPLHTLFRPKDFRPLMRVGATVLLLVVAVAERLRLVVGDKRSFSTWTTAR